MSRKFVAMTETALTDLLAADLSELDLVALMIDGVHFADHLCVVALGIDIDGTKHPLALVEGSTENTTLVRGLLVGLRDRGLDITKPDPGRPGRRQGPSRRRPPLPKFHDPGSDPWLGTGRRDPRRLSRGDPAW